MFDTQMIIEAVNRAPFIGSGAARSVYELNDLLVVKIPERGGSVQSWHEIEFYDRWKEQYGHLMAEIYGYITIDGRPWIFMEKVDCLDEFVVDYINNNYNQDEAAELILMIDDFIDYTGLADSDVSSENWGKTKDGRLVALDLGINVYDWVAYEWYEDCDEDYPCYSYG